MADLYPNIRMPQLNFDWLGELGPISEGVQSREGLKTSLADLQSSDPKSLREAAARAFSLGTKEGIDAGVKLSAAAQHQEDNATRAAQTNIQMEYLKKLGSGGLLTGGLPGAQAPTPETPYVPAPGGGGPAPVSPFDRPAGQLPIPGPRSEAAPPSPSDQMITQAQGAIAPPPPGPQLAGPPPTPDTAPPAPLAPPWLQGAQMQAETTPQLPEPPPLPGVSERQRALAEANFWTNKAAELTGPKGLGSGLQSVIRKRIDDALARAKPSQLEADFMQENFRRATAGKGEPLLQSPAEYKSMIELAPKLTEAAHATYEKDYRDRGQKGESLTNDLMALGELAKNPKFAPGESGLIDSFLSKVGSVNDKLKSIGVPENMLLTPEQVKNITTPVALREAYSAIVSRAVISALGGLGRQISDPDRNYMDKAFGNLLMTKGGAEIVRKFMQEVADRQRFQAKAAQDYLKNNNRATSAQMDQYVDAETTKKYGSKGLLSYDNGNPTQLKLQMDRELAKAQTEPAPASARRTAPSGGGGKMVPGETIYDSSGRPFVVTPDGKLVPQGAANGNSL